tara:strand:+ start:809 stop:1027 length:219 start_codon:yes stop_codon:yes gene_type:complete
MSICPNVSLWDHPAYRPPMHGQIHENRVRTTGQVSIKVRLQEEFLVASLIGVDEMFCGLLEDIVYQDVCKSE